MKLVAKPEAILALIDNSELLAAIEELSAFAQIIFQLPPSVADLLVRFVNGEPKIAHIESSAAKGACQIITVKPSDSFNDLLATLRAAIS